jgi:hypothetical protein
MVGNPPKALRVQPQVRPEKVARKDHGTRQRISVVLLPVCKDRLDSLPRGFRLPGTYQDRDATPRQQAVAQQIGSQQAGRTGQKKIISHLFAAPAHMARGRGARAIWVISACRQTFRDVHPDAIRDGYVRRVIHSGEGAYYVPRDGECQPFGASNDTACRPSARLKPGLSVL